MLFCFHQSFQTPHLCFGTSSVPSRYPYNWDPGRDFLTPLIVYSPISKPRRSDATLAAPECKKDVKKRHYTIVSELEFSQRAPSLLLSIWTVHLPCDLSPLKRDWSTLPRLPTENQTAYQYQNHNLYSYEGFCLWRSLQTIRPFYRI